MADPHRLVERVRELSEHDHEQHELRLRDRLPPSAAQRERAEDARAEPRGGDGDA